MDMNEYHGTCHDKSVINMLEFPTFNETTAGRLHNSTNFLGHQLRENVPFIHTRGMFKTKRSILLVFDLAAPLAYSSAVHPQIGYRSTDSDKYAVQVIDM